MYNYKTHGNTAASYASFYDVDEIPVSLLENNSLVKWNGGNPEITINGVQNQFNQEEAWRKKTFSEIGAPDKYLTWKQSKKEFPDSKHYYVKKNTFVNKDAFYQNGAGVPLFTIGGNEEGYVPSRETENPITTREGELVITYKLLSGAAGPPLSYPVKIEVRGCESFTNGLYDKVQDGIYQDHEDHE